MILTVLALGGTVLGATTIAGLLMLYQIRQTSDLANSGKAIYGAESGIELGLYRVLQASSTLAHATPTVPFSNGAGFTVHCYEADVDCNPGAEIACATALDDSTTGNVLIRSLGSASRAARGYDHCLRLR